ncbi:diphthamide biosynthesis protein, partial [Tilletiaria anomala UBC 951]
MSIEELYDIRSTALKILGFDPQGDAKRRVHLRRFKSIALQFPDELLCDSVPIYWALKKALRELLQGQAIDGSGGNEPAEEPELYILADTSYGNCCVDEVASAHVSADLVVHYGHACLSLTARLPTLYVFSKLSINVDQAALSLSEKLQSAWDDEGKGKARNVALLYEVGYAHKAGHIAAALRKVPTTCGCGSTGYAPNLSTCNASPGSARYLSLPSELTVAECDIIYIGSAESLSLINLLLSHPPSTRFPRLFITYDPRAHSATARIEDGRATNRLLMRRYALVQKAKDASVVGLLVGTLGVVSYLPLLKSLRKLLTGKGSRRKVYTISVGKLNPAKLANFQEIDIFVLVACPENSLALHGTGGGSHAGKDYFKPVITPFEMVVALRSLEEGDSSSGGWTDGYELDLGRLSLRSEQDNESKAAGDWGDDGDDDDSYQRRPHFSLVTGSFVSRQTYRSNQALRQDRGNAKAIGADDALASGGIDSRTIALRQADGTLTRVLDSASPAHLEGRAWKGLERRIGLDPPAALEEGRAGIARGYAD